MAPYYSGDDGDDGFDYDSVGRRLLAGLRDREAAGGPDETGQGPPPPPITMGQYQGQVRPTDVGFKKRPELPEEIDNVVRQAKQGALDGSEPGPRRMAQPVSMVTPQPTLGERSGAETQPAATAAPDASPMPAASPAAPSVTVAPGIAKRSPADMRRMTDISPRPSMVSALPPAPSAPEADPRRAAAIDTISQTSAPTPKTDAQGNTLPQYKMGLGRRILMGAAQTLAHGVPGLVGATSNPNDPNYIGPGATNSRYARDEAMRQGKLKGATEQQSALDREAALQEKDFANKNTQYRDEARTAAQQDVLGERTQKDEAVKQYHDAVVEINRLKEENKTPTKESQTIAYSGALAKMEQGGEKTSPTDVKATVAAIRNSKILSPEEKGAALGYLGANYVPADKGLNVHINDGAKWSKVDEANIMAYARDHQIPGKNADEVTRNMSKQQFDEAQGRKPSGGETFVNSAERSEYNRRTGGIDRQIQKYEEDVRQNTEASAAPGIDANSKATLDAMAATAQRQIDQLESQKQKVEQEIVGRRPQTAAPTPAGRAQQPVAPPAQPAAAQPGKPPAHNPEGVKNSKGQYYQYVAKGKGGQRVGSDDGKSWVDLKTGQPLR